MRHIIIPTQFDNALKLEEEEPAYIVCDTPQPTRIIFSRGNIIQKNVLFISKVKNYTSRKDVMFKYNYAIVSIPSKYGQKYNLKQRTCEKTMCLENRDGDFIIILK